MQTFSKYRRLVLPLVAVLAMAAAVIGPAFAQPPALPELPVSDPVVPITARRAELTVTERFSKVVSFQNKVTRVDGFDPEVINVTALAANQLRIQALATGVTTIVVIDELGTAFTIDLFVVGDVRHLQSTITKMFPRAAIEVMPVRDTVVLRGWVTQPEHVQDIIDVTRRFYAEPINQMRVGGLQLVQLNVVVMEVQRSKIRRLGFNFISLDQNSYLSSTPGSLAQLSSLSVPFGGPPGVVTTAASLADSTITGGIVSDNHIFQGFLEALKQESLLKILAEPKLITTNGRPANMLAGGEFPILVPQSLGTTTIEWREFGVRMEAVPILLGNGRVRLELQPEVSERDFTNAVTLQGSTVPGLTTRRVNTAVEMNFGQTLMLSGLLSTRKTATTSKVPFLGELPWVGAAFRRIRYDEAETELVICVTPQLVSPMDACQVPAGGPGLFSDVPSSRELFGHGLLEVPYYGDHCSGPGCEPGLPAPLTGPNGPLPPAYPGGPQGGYDPTMPPAPSMSPTPVPVPPPSAAPPTGPESQDLGEQLEMSRRKSLWGGGPATTPRSSGTRQVSHTYTDYPATPPARTNARTADPRQPIGPKPSLLRP